MGAPTMRLMPPTTTPAAPPPSMREFAERTLDEMRRLSDLAAQHRVVLTGTKVGAVVDDAVTALAHVLVENRNTRHALAELTDELARLTHENARLCQARGEEHATGLLRATELVRADLASEP